jgi:hypothetical protein
MIRYAVAFVALLWLPSASANLLYKCVGPKGQTAVQSDPCPKGHKTEWVRGYTPDRTPQRPTQRPRAQSRPSQQTYYYDAPSSPSKRELQESRCRSAREYEATQRRLNPKLSYDQLTALHDRTAEACRGL